MNSVTLNCIRGKARLSVQGGFVRLLTGDRRKWDGLYWALYSDDRIALQGLYRGTYADAVVEAGEFLAALERLGCLDLAAQIREVIDQANRE